MLEGGGKVPWPILPLLSLAADAEAARSRRARPQEEVRPARPAEAFRPYDRAFRFSSSSPPSSYRQRSPCEARASLLIPAGPADALPGSRAGMRSAFPANGRRPQARCSAPAAARSNPRQYGFQPSGLAPQRCQAAWSASVSWLLRRHGLRVRSGVARPGAGSRA
jgi:hypothetical protein